MEVKTIYVSEAKFCFSASPKDFMAVLRQKISAIKDLYGNNVNLTINVRGTFIQDKPNGDLCFIDWYKQIDSVGYKSLTMKIDFKTCRVRPWIVEGYNESDYLNFEITAKEA